MWLIGPLIQLTDNDSMNCLRALGSLREVWKWLGF